MPKSSTQVAVAIADSQAGLEVHDPKLSRAQGKALAAACRDLERE